MPSYQHQLVKRLLSAAAGPIARHRPSVNGLRLGLELSTLLQFMPWGVHFHRAETGCDVVAEWIEPEGADQQRVLLYLHGGGYVMGSLNTHRGFIGALAQRCGLRALSVDYRKAPEHPFPAALDDALAAWRWLLTQGYAPHDIMLAGDSAGGGLVLALLLHLRDARQPLPAAALCFSPWTDLNLPASVDHIPDEARFIEALEIRSWGRHYAADTPLTHPLVSPLYAELRGLPPLLLQVSDGELLFHDSLALAARARAAGTAVTVQQFEGLVHWWHLFWRAVPEARTALQRTAGFARGVWAAQAAAHRSVQKLPGVLPAGPRAVRAAA
ncbi:steryl acetyl hydrolase [Hymenobacter gummosus]|uniref:Steryl acetyl hydrolase n=1 Tax=Hymenobacter gummosus TaxID=1776032 RepID=A0A3S0QGT3_9BACT|nr:alpha/beta hydrolase fold domain-containing protein [Hymenobacter gummosus]RTQ48229.1 steryl acetyl hydrolase [Hymenobacter gummosus]